MHLASVRAFIPKEKNYLAHNQLSTAKVHAAFARAAGERHLLADSLDPALGPRWGEGSMKAACTWRGICWT